jgi:hypothetical protein
MPEIQKHPSFTPGFFFHVAVPYSSDQNPTRIATPWTPSLLNQMESEPQLSHNLAAIQSVECGAILLLANFLSRERNQRLKEESIDQVPRVSANNLVLVPHTEVLEETTLQRTKCKYRCNTIQPSHFDGASRYRRQRSTE